MKAIREFAGIKESATCNTCTKRQVCKVRDIGFSEMSVSKKFEKEKGEVKIEDVQNALYGVYNISKKNESLKVDDQLTIEVKGEMKTKPT